MKTNTLILLFLCFALSNCKNEPKAETTTAAINLNLNEGEKWVVNPETHEGILKMDAIINTFKKEEQKNYTILGENLSRQTSYIIKNCSMEGESHDKLHVVLVPMLDAISTLKESKNSEKSNIVLTELEAYIDGYFNHFKL